MASPIWRRRGYVPDSDDEDESSFTESLTHSDNLLQQRPDGANDLNAQPIDHQTVCGFSDGRSFSYDAERNTQNAARYSTSKSPELSFAPQDIFAPTLDEHHALSIADEPSGTSQVHKGYTTNDSSPLSSIAEELSSELEFGLQTIEEILHPIRNNGQITPYEDGTQTRQRSPVGTGQRAVETTGAEAPRQEESARDEESGLDARNGGGSQRSPTSSHLQPARALRHRNPIQVHPYALELSRYQQSLRARGLRPHRIASPERERSSSPFEAPERDISSLRFSRQCGDSETLSCNNSSPARNQENSVTEDSGPNSVTMTGGRGEDLPEVEDLLRQGQFPKDTLTRKRRRRYEQDRSNGDPFVIQRQDSSVFDLPMDDDSGITSERFNGSSNALISPPRSSNNALETGDESPIFRYPLGLSPPNPPTPIASSEARQCTNKNGQRGASPLPALTLEEDQSSSPSSLLTQNNEPDLTRLKRMARTIHGVLPAAFLRLNTKSNRAPQSSLPNSKDTAYNIANGLGVARKVYPKQKRDQCKVADYEPMFLDSEDSSSESEIPPQGEHVRNDVADLDSDEGVFHLQTIDDEVVEDNAEIDFMAPQEQRRYSTGTGARKRQKLFKDGWEHKLPNMANNRPSSKSTPRQRRHRTTVRARQLADQKRVILSTASIPLKLGILDSPDVVQQPRQDWPLFLRIAARRARSQKFQGRKYPSYGQIRLATDQDNEDIAAVWRNWQYDSVPRDLSSIPTTREGRPILAERSNVQRLNYRVSPKQTTENRSIEQKESRDSIPGEAIEPSDAIEKLQSHANRLPPFTRQQNASTRPGKGRLVTTFGGAQQFRAAQVEQDKRARTLKENLKTKAPVSVPDFTAMRPGNRPKAIPLDRFLKSQAPETNGTASPLLGSEHSRGPQKLLRRRQARKRPPKRLDTPTEISKEHQHTLEKLRSMADRSVLVERADLLAFENLDLGKFQVNDAFEMTTFVGSGHFSQLLSSAFGSKDHTSPSRVASTATSVHLKADSSSWPKQTLDDLSSNFLSLLSSIGSNLTIDDDNIGNQFLQANQFEGLKDKLMSVVTYVSDRLKLQSVSFQSQVIGDLLLETAKFLKGSEAIRGNFHGFAKHRAPILEVASRLALLCFKAWQFSHAWDHMSDLFHTADSQLKAAVRFVLYLLVEQDGTEVLRKRVHETRLSTGRKLGLEDIEAESLVIINNILHCCRDANSWESIWDHLKANMANQNHPPRSNITHKENNWKTLFALLPFLEIDCHGVREDEIQQPEDVSLWNIVQDLITPAVACFNRSATDSLFYRCYSLAISWGWKITPDALNSMLEMLLVQVDDTPLYRPTSGLEDILAFSRSVACQTEPSTSIALKLMAQSIYNRHRGDPNMARNASSLVAKVTPTLSHGTFQTPTKLDLALIRQQYDVLSIIYVSSPKSSRPSLRQFKRLVPLQQASVQVSQIAVELCKRMMLFELKSKLGTVEFTGWLEEIILDTLRHWKGGQLKASVADAIPPLNPYLLSHEHLLTYSLSAIQDLTAKCAHGDQVISVIPRNALHQLFHSSLQDIRLQGVLQAVISIIKEIVAWPQVESSCLPKRSEDDSQDFGTIDWQALVEERDDGHVNVLKYVLDEFYLPIKRLLSSVLRSESTFSRTVFQDVLKCWATMAHFLVREGIREWSAYLEPHADDSWSHFEDCTHTTDGMILFLVEVMRLNPHFYRAHRDTVLKCYVKGLVDLDFDATNLAQLQCLLLESKCSTDDILQLVRPEQSRLDAITTIIINMQQIWHASGDVDLRGDRCKLVREFGFYMIQAMEKSWRASSQDNMTVAQRKVDLYSGIVHALLIYLPEYAPQLEYFTKGDQFPYKDTAIFVKIQGYARQLSEGKNVVKAFITYIHSLLENAAANCGGEELATQIVLAMGLNLFIDDLSDDKIEHAKKVRNGETVSLTPAPLPTAVNTKEAHQLRFFLLGTVFPPYITKAFSSTGRFLFKPILGVLIRTYETLSLCSGEWNDIPRLHQVTEEILDVSRATLASHHSRENPSTGLPVNQMEDWEMFGGGLEQLIDLAEATLDYMERVRECEEEREGGGRTEGGTVCQQTDSSVSVAATRQENDLLRYTERTIEDWTKQVVVKQDAYFVRGKCIGRI